MVGIGRSIRNGHGALSERLSAGDVSGVHRSCRQSHVLRCRADK